MSVVKIVVQLQYRENYGMYNPPESGKVKHYWKMKGGTELVIAGTFERCEIPSMTALQKTAIAYCEKHKLVHSDDFSETYIASIDIEDADEWFTRHTEKDATYREYGSKYEFPVEIPR